MPFNLAAAIGITTTAATGLWSANVKAAPKRGGHLRVGSEGGSNTDAIDPRRAIGTDQFSCPIMSMFDTLTYLDADAVPQPCLCESWEASADAVTWRFKIRKDIEFHNGKTMTPEDIVASYNYEDNDANTHGDSRSIMASIEEKTVDGDYVVLKLKPPNADLPTVLTAYGLLIGPAGTETPGAIRRRVCLCFPGTAKPSSFFRFSPWCRRRVSSAIVRFRSSMFFCR